MLSQRDEAYWRGAGTTRTVLASGGAHTDGGPCTSIRIPGLEVGQKSWPNSRNLAGKLPDHNTNLASLDIIRGGGSGSAVAGPVGVEELAARAVDALVGVGAEDNRAGLGAGWRAIGRCGSRRNRTGPSSWPATGWRG